MVKKPKSAEAADRAGRRAFSIEETASQLGISTQLVRRTMRTVLVGDRRLVPAEEIHKVLGSVGDAA